MHVWFATVAYVEGQLPYFLETNINHLQIIYFVLLNFLMINLTFVIFVVRTF